MKKKTFSKLLASSAILGGVLFSGSAFAVGTDAGISIENTATVSFTRNGSTDSEQASVSFNVDEIINVNVTGSGAIANVTNGEEGVALSYTVTNLGNGPEEFVLLKTIGATNDLPLDVADLKVYYVDTTTSDGSFDPNDIDETLYTAGDSISILNDESITVYIVADVPNAAVLDSLTDLELTAVSQTEAGGVKASESSFGTVITGAGESGTDAIVAVEQGRDDDSSELKVTIYDASQTLEVLIDKSILGSSALLNDTSTVTTQKIPGAMVTYFIKVTVENDTATELNISDIIPTDMTYVDNSLRKQSAVGSTITTPTYLTPTLSTNTPATYVNFTALTDDSSDADGAETILDSGDVDSISVDFGDLEPGEYAILLDAIINN
jgi:uncharacterized repeat protein (TIGR01451 family)